MIGDFASDGILQLLPWLAGPMEKLHSLPKHILESEEAQDVQSQYDRLVVEMNQYEKATVEVRTTK